MLNISRPGLYRSRGLHQALNYSILPLRPALHLQRHSRYLSSVEHSTTPSSTPPPNSRRSSPAFALIALISALIGFGAAKSSFFTDVTASNPSKAHTPVFGSPRDIQNAIAELRITFGPGDKVSTDPDDLHDHGFSPNEHHPGTSSSC